MSHSKPNWHYCCLLGDASYEALLLRACTALTRLVLTESCLADSNQVHLDTHLCLVPTCIQLLTQLHTLHLAGRKHVSLADLEWMSNLTALQDLSISFGSDCTEVLEHVAELAKLTSLELVGLCTGLHANLNIEWYELKALQHLSICSFTLQLDADVGGLLTLPNLKEISFAGCIIEHADELHAFAALMYNLARVCPHVNVCIDPDHDGLLSYFDFL